MCFLSFYLLRPLCVFLILCFFSRLSLVMPSPGGIKRWCCLTSDVCRVHPVGGRRVWPAGWMARIGWSGLAQPAWLKAADAGFRCRPRRGHIVAASHLQLVCSDLVVSTSPSDWLERLISRMTCNVLIRVNGCVKPYSLTSTFSISMVLDCVTDILFLQVYAAYMVSY